MKYLENIKSIRKAKGLTQQEMSEGIGMAKNNYGKVENGQIELTVSRLYQIADILGVSIVTLLGEHVGDAQQVAELEKENAVLKADLERAKKTLDILLPMAENTFDSFFKVAKALQDKSTSTGSKDEVELSEGKKQLIKSVMDSIFPEEP